MKTSTITNTAAPALLLIAWLLLPQTAHCFYNPSTGRWLSRDPIGEQGGLHLCSFVRNEPTSRIDATGRIPIEGPGPACATCRCKVVSVNPEQSVTVGTPPYTGRGFPQGSRWLRVGVRTPYTIEIQGNAKACSCSYTDDGYIKFDVTVKVPGYPDNSTKGTVPYANATHPTHGGCVSGEDWPGLETLVGPLAGSGTYEFDYNLKVTVRCTDSNGVSIEDSKVITGKYNGNYTFPAGTK